MCERDLEKVADYFKKLSERNIEATNTKSEVVDMKGNKKNSATGELDQEVNIEELDTYAQRKNYFNGLLHLALLIASTTQLLNCYKNHRNPFPIAFLCASMVLQLIAGVLLILDHRMRIKTRKDLKLGTRYTISMTTMIFFAIVLNMLFTGFELFGLNSLK